jgi:hypothetical protein
MNPWLLLQKLLLFVGSLVGAKVGAKVGDAVGVEVGCDVARQDVWDVGSDT